MTQAGQCSPNPVFPLEKWGWYPPLQGFTPREHVCLLAGCWGLRKGLAPTLSLPWYGCQFMGKMGKEGEW